MPAPNSSTRRPRRQERNKRGGEDAAGDGEVAAASASQLRVSRCTISAAHPSHIKLPMLSPTRSSATKENVFVAPSVDKDGESAAELDDAAAWADPSSAPSACSSASESGDLSVMRLQRDCKRARRACITRTKEQMDERGYAGLRSLHVVVLCCAVLCER